MFIERRVFLYAALCTVLVVGCGPKGRGLPTAKVKGTVKYAANKIPEGQINFQHDTGEMTGMKFGADGIYELDVPVGKNKVMVTSLVSNQGESSKGSGKQMEVFTNRVPDKYSNFDSSGLEVDVPKDGTTYDVTLTK